MRLRLPTLLILVATLCLSACGSDDGGSRAPIAVLSAFPAELAAVLDHVNVEDTVVIADRTFRIGTVGETPVVVGMTGIGLVNAANVTRALLEQMEVSGVVVSGVAGSSLRIGDVAVPMDWKLADGSTFTSDPSWLATAEEVAAAAGMLSFERCTRRPAAPNDDPVCLVHEPQIFVGGTGESDDAFPTAVVCQPGAGDVFGCDVVPAGSSTSAAAQSGSGSGNEVAVEAVDMESAAIAREAAAAGVRFIALRGFRRRGRSAQSASFRRFFTYYRLAAATRLRLPRHSSSKPVGEWCGTDPERAQGSALLVEGRRNMPACPEHASSQKPLVADEAKNPLQFRPAGDL
jgi:nucleoside phosphorylase